MSPIDTSKYYTYADYCSWDDERRWELIGGTPYLMSSPATKHQLISGELFFQLATFLKGKSPRLFATPFDVRLNPHAADDTVVQPDLLVIRDLSKLDDKCCVGAPDMVVEILSPSTANHDRVVKMEVYQQAKVREYWIVDPTAKIVEIFILENGQYHSKMYSDVDIAPVAVLEGCEIDLHEVFSE